MVSSCLVIAGGEPLRHPDRSFQAFGALVGDARGLCALGAAHRFPLRVQGLIHLKSYRDGGKPHALEIELFSSSAGRKDFAGALRRSIQLVLRRR